MQFDLEHINGSTETFQMNMKHKITAVLENKDSYFMWTQIAKKQ